MRLTEDKISHIAHLLRTCIEKNSSVKIKDTSEVLKIAKQVLENYCILDEKIDSIVRKKLETYKRDLQEGSREWDLLYKKHFEEELNKKW